MSIYFGASAILVGKTEPVFQVHSMVLEDEKERPSEFLGIRQVYVPTDGFCAILYRASKTTYRPVLYDVMCSQDARAVLQGQEVCKLFEYFAESGQGAGAECEFRGRIVATANSSQRQANTQHVRDVFVEHCERLGIDARSWLGEIPRE